MGIGDGGASPSPANRERPGGGGASPISASRGLSGVPSESPSPAKSGTGIMGTGAGVSAPCKLGGFDLAAKWAESVLRAGLSDQLSLLSVLCAEHCRW